ncbi:MAG: hypothetical protein LR015_14455 [Verrucomicrobia bacterium]|nr:hypothetical protein [Verrucomicrobiota bacterium]
MVELPSCPAASRRSKKTDPKATVWKLSRAFQRVAAIFRGAVTLWFNDDRPRDEFNPRIVDMSIGNIVPPADPVLVDLLTGFVYDLPNEFVTGKDSLITLHGLAIHDYPVVILDRSWITVNQDVESSPSNPTNH